MAGVASPSSALDAHSNVVPGTPDPRLMVLRLGDLPAGAKVVEQRYFTDRGFGNALSYSREFEGGRLGGTELLGLESIAEVGRSVSESRSALHTVRTSERSGAARY